MTPALATAVLVITALLLAWAVSGGRRMPLSRSERSLLLMSQCCGPLHEAAPPSPACCWAFSYVVSGCGAPCLCPLVLDPSAPGFSSSTSGIFQIFQSCSKSDGDASLANFSSVLSSCNRGYDEVQLISNMVRSVDSIWVSVIMMHVPQLVLACVLLLVLLGVRRRMKLRRFFRS